MENLHRDQILANINRLAYKYLSDASTCWDLPPTGGFQANKVKGLGDRLTAYISQYIICESDEVN